jgi:transmembrane sensor
MTDDSSFDPILLDRYLAGELSPAERVRVDAWLAAHPVSADVLRNAPRALEGSMSASDTDRSWAALAARIAAAKAADQDDLAARRAKREATTRRVSTVPHRRPWVRIAAAVAVVISGATTWKMMSGAEAGSIAAPLGRDVTATLPDGSTLKLAAGSRVSWTSAFGRFSREVSLEGEGYFDVKHDRLRRFRVVARDAIAEDVGTRFVVRAWAELPNVEVAVEEGVVALSDTTGIAADDVAFLKAGQRGVLEADGRITVSTTAEPMLAWTRGQLVFDNTPLSEALPSLNRRFDVDIRVDAALNSRQLSARFDSTSLTDVLGAIALSLDVRVERDGRIITLHPITR